MDEPEEIADIDKEKLDNRIKELEASVESLTKQNSKLKNELKFTKDTERRTSREYITALQRDLEALQAKNEKISSTLIQVESQLKSNQIAQAKVEASNSAKAAAQSAALVERLSSVQREREKVLAGQLRKVMEEKEQLLKKLKDRGHEELDTSQSTDENASLENSHEPSELLHVVEALQNAKGVFELQHSGDLLVKKVKDVQREKWRNVQDKIAMLKQESLDALRKKEATEGQIEKLKRQIEIMKTEYKLVDKTRTKSLQAQLQSAMLERDKWKSRAEKFEDTIETLQVVNSLQRSMSKESSIKQQYEEELHKCRQEIELLTKNLNAVIKERNLLVQERPQLILQIRQESERAERLHRLVMLRKKVAATSSPRDSINSDKPVYDI